MAIDYHRFNLFLARHGFSTSDARKWVRKWRNLKARTNHTGTEMTLSLKCYVLKAKAAKIVSPDQIGRKPHLYQLGRYGDSGGYTKNNCRFITMRQNLRERKINGGAQACGDKIRGRTKLNDKSVASMAAIMASRNKKNHSGVAAGALKKSRSYVIISPDGKKYVGRNLKEFCIEHGLKGPTMSRLLRGIYKTAHGGWKGHYTDE